MDIEQKTDLTYVKIEEIDKKINKMIDDISDLSPFSDDSNNTAKIASISSNVVTIMGQNVNVKTDTEKLLTDTSTLINDSNSIKTNTEILIDDTSTLKNDTDTLKIDVSTIKTTMETISDNLESGFDLSEINTSLNTKAEEIKTNIDTSKNEICDSIKGVDNIDITQINDRLNAMTTFLGKFPTPLDFEEDPFKLDEEFTEYIPNGEIYNNHDFMIEYEQYNVNENSNNGYNCFAFLAVYCEDETFDLKLTIDVDNPNTNCNIEIIPFGYSINNVNNTFINLVQGNNLISQTITFNSAPENNNKFIRFRFTNSNVTINSYRIDVYGKNISILTKPTPYKIFCKKNKILISKLYKNNGYILELETDKLNPADLNKTYTHEFSKILDFHEIYATYYQDYYSLTSHFTKIICKDYITLSNKNYFQVEDAEEYNAFSVGLNFSCSLIDNAHYSAFARAFFLSISSDGKAYSSGINPQFYGYINSTYLGELINLSAKTTLIYDMYNIHKTTTSEIYTIATLTDGSNVLYLQYLNGASTLNLGFGKNLTAYFEKDNRNCIHVYMKVGDKMVKKIVNITETTDEEGVTTKSAEITSEKVIGTYDFYFETPSDKYFVLKDDKLYLFKN